MTTRVLFSSAGVEDRVLYYKHAQELTGSYCLKLESCAVIAGIPGLLGSFYVRPYFLAELDLFNVLERTIFAKVKSSIYYKLSNLIPVTNSEENVSVEPSCLASWLSASVLVDLHFRIFGESVLIVILDTSTSTRF